MRNNGGVQAVDIQKVIDVGMVSLIAWVGEADELCRIFMFKRMVKRAELGTLRSVREQLNRGIQRDNEAALLDKRCDVVTMLPKHLAKHIFSFMDYEEVENAIAVSKPWHQLCREVLDEKNEQRDGQDYVLDLQAVCDPTFAQWCIVRLDYLFISVFLRLIITRFRCSPTIVV